MSPTKTAQQNIQNLFFDKGAPLHNEYHKLFASLFDGAEVYKTLLENIAQKREGKALTALADSPGITSGGNLSEHLQPLCDAGFIEKYIPWKKERGAYYKVIDEFCLFYIYWVKNEQTKKFASDHWVVMSQTPRYHAWSGYACEAVCAKHTLKIIQGLGISSASTITSWKYTLKTTQERGAQIDLVIVRGDDAITLCEIKYTDKPFVIDKSYAAILQNKINSFQKHTQTTKQLFLSMIAAHGIKPTIYSEELVSSVVTLTDLFRSYG